MIRKNSGQVLDSDLQLRPEIIGYFESSPLGIFLRDKSKVSFTLAALHNDSTTADTLYRVDMVLSKTKERIPNFFHTAPGIANYYRGTHTTEGVVANYRAVYQSIQDSIDCHFYGSKGGPRIAFVIRPGGNPADIKLSFHGQDSLGIDWQGALKVYLRDKWVKLEQAVAYQVSGTTLIPVPWTGGYTHEEGTAYAGFTFGSYNPELPLILQIGYSAIGGGASTELRNLEWCTYAASDDGDELRCVEVDERGDPYYCGFSYILHYPTELGTIVFPATEPEQPGVYNGVTFKVDHITKQLIWTSLVGGMESAVGTPAKTESHKLTIYQGPLLSHQYVFITGSTNATDFPAYRDPLTTFSLADVTGYLGGTSRMWVSALNKNNGYLDWSTTHGQPNGQYTWGEHGLAIDIDATGALVVGGQIETYFTSLVTPNFPLLTPSGAFSRSLGDGFFIQFAPDFTIAWSTTFCEFSGAAAKGFVSDIAIVKKQDPPQKAMWLVGANNDMPSQSFDLVAPPAGGYYETQVGETSAFIAFVNLETRTLEYSTLWGSSSSIGKGAAHAVHVTRAHTYVVGFTNQQDLTETELPPPPTGQTGAHWTTTNNSSFPLTDAFLLRFDNWMDNFILSYGTLMGGLRDDIFIDVNGDNDGNVYITGETRSSTDFAVDLNPELFYQSQNDFWNRRDAIILGMKDEEYPNIFWRTAFGGVKSDRGSGIAATPYEVHLCGTTSSNYSDNFPLLEFNSDPNDPNSSLDWYWDFLLGGTANELTPWRSFQQAMCYEMNGIDVFIEPYNIQHDAFIASFRMQEEPVGLADVAYYGDVNGLVLRPLDAHGHYEVLPPSDGAWRYVVFDAAGRSLYSDQSTSSNYLLDLRAYATGVYLLVAEHLSGKRLTIKVLKP